MNLPTLSSEETMKYLKAQREYGTYPYRETLVKAIENMKPGIAADYGCGSFRESNYLAEHGWKVYAVDKVEDVKMYLELLPKEIQEKIEFKADSISKEVVKDNVDLVCAFYSLPFIDHDFYQTMKCILNSIKIGGKFAGSFFGKKDDWYGYSPVTCLSEQEIRDMFTNFEIDYIVEKEKDLVNNNGHNKHYHTYELIATKKRCYYCQYQFEHWSLNPDEADFDLIVHIHEHKHHPIDYILQNKYRLTSGIIRYLVDNGADVNYRFHQSPPEFLLHACRVGDIDLVKYLIDKGCKLNDYCPLHLRIAVHHNHKDIIKLLLDKGCNAFRNRDLEDKIFEMFGFDRDGLNRKYEIYNELDSIVRELQDLTDILTKKRNDFANSVKYTN